MNDIASSTTLYVFSFLESEFPKQHDSVPVFITVSSSSPIILGFVASTALFARDVSVLFGGFDSE